MARSFVVVVGQKQLFLLANARIPPKICRPIWPQGQNEQKNYGKKQLNEDSVAGV